MMARLGTNITRRGFLSASAVAALWGAARVRGANAVTPPFFEEVPSSSSGITWTHENAKSDMPYLPEAPGPGCAFLDYDNHGCMDIYLVNSRPCDFWKPTKP